ncbi:unnamed protein product [Boreogadus saida]
MADGTEYADGHNMEDWDFEEVMVETDVRGYLYEPQYIDEQLRAMEEQEAAEAVAATAEADDLPAADEEPSMARAGADWWCLCSHCASMDTGQESVCCREFQWGQCLLDEFLTPHLNSWVWDTYFRTQKVYWKRQPKPAGRNRAIRANYPAQDGQYRGYQETVDAEDEL